MSKGKILIVEPDADNRLQIHELLEADGYEIQSTTDVVIAKEYAEAKLPDFIIHTVEDFDESDYALALWAMNKATQGIGVVIMYRVGRMGDKFKESAGYLIEFLHIPIHPRELLARVRAIMTRIYRRRLSKYLRQKYSSS